MKTYRLLILLVLALGCAGLRSPASGDGGKRIEDVIYGRLPGVALTMDVFEPEKPTGVGVLFMVSGGWFSSHEAINPGMMQPFLSRGQTVFAIVHGSQPKYSVSEILP